MRVICCHSNETRAPIAKPPNVAQLGASPTIPPSYIRVRVSLSSVGMRRGTDRHTHTDGRGYYTFRLGYAARP